MFAAVHRFLIEEIVDLAAQRLRRALAIMAHRRHEEFLADREGRGQRVEKGGAAGIAAMPPTRRRGFATEFEVALFDSYSSEERSVGKECVSTCRSRGSQNQ